MPELAEVEFYRKQWDCGLSCNVIAVKIHAQKRIFRGSNTRSLVSRLGGQKLLRSTARGKQMLFEFSGGNWLGIHLGMSGRLRTEKADFVPEKHDHLVLQQARQALIFRDPRLFGRVRFHHGTTPPQWWLANSAEINSRQFSREFFDQFLARHGRAPIKAVLLLQKGFPGIGNWMADEILWRAKISPKTRAGRLNARQRATLYRATRFVSRASLRIIGTDFSDPPRHWLIHQKWKAKGVCPRDGSLLRHERIGGRSTAWCPRCQSRTRLT